MEVPKPPLCAQGTHVVQKMPTGLYICVQCLLSFHEHHEIVLNAGTTAGPRTPLPAQGGRHP